MNHQCNRSEFNIYFGHGMSYKKSSPAPGGWKEIAIEQEKLIAKLILVIDGLCTGIRKATGEE